MWVICTSSAWFPFLTLPAWTPIQDVSHLHLLCLISIPDIACMNFYPGSESSAPSLLDFHFWHCLHELLSREWVICTFAWFPFLTLPVWTPIQQVSHLHLCLISIPDVACMNFYPVCESCGSLPWFLLLILPVWNSIQNVSHVQLFCLIFIANIAHIKSLLGCELLFLSLTCPLLDFDCWYYFIHYLVCSYSNTLSSPYSINMSTFDRQMVSSMLLTLNLM